MISIVFLCSGEGKSLMPYEIWEEKLRKRLIQWYKVLHDCANSVEKVSVSYII